jgi:hypothetical protein
MLRAAPKQVNRPFFAVVGLWHKTDLRLAAPEGRFTGGLPTLGAECLVSGGKPTVFERALKVGS